LLRARWYDFTCLSKNYVEFVEATACNIIYHEPSRKKLISIKHILPIWLNGLSFDGYLINKSFDGYLINKKN